MHLSGDGPLAATALIDRLLVSADGRSLPVGSAFQLALDERDRIVAALYEHCFGDRIECRAPCDACGKPFDIAFSLSALLADLAERGEAPPFPLTGPDEQGHFALGEGTVFRLPTADDERSVAGLVPEEAASALVRRCLLRAGAESHLAEAAMERIAPLLEQEIAAPCPDCGTATMVTFDVVSFFLSALRGERALLTREVHRLASAYHWPLDDILNLPRTMRREYVALVEAERGRSRAVR